MNNIFNIIMTPYVACMGHLIVGICASVTLYQNIGAICSMEHSVLTAICIYRYWSAFSRWDSSGARCIEKVLARIGIMIWACVVLFEIDGPVLREYPEIRNMINVDVTTTFIAAGLIACDLVPEFVI